MFAGRWARFAPTFPVAVFLFAMVLAGAGPHKAFAQQNAGTLHWQPTLDDAKRMAASSNRLILVHFWAPWNEASVALESTVYSQPPVQQFIHSRLVPIRLNVDDFPTTAKQYGVDRIPTDLIITHTGQIVGRLNCPLAPDAYLRQLEAAMTSAPSAPAIVANSAAAPAAAAPSAVPPSTSAAATTVGNAAPQPGPGWITLGAGAAPPYAPSSHPAAPTTAAGAAPPIANQPPAIAAYSNERYAEYFQKYGQGETSPIVHDTAAASQPVAPADAHRSPANARLPNVELPPEARIAQTNTAQTNTAQANSGPAPSPTISPTLPSTTLAAFGLEGYCPVTLIEQKRWQVGDRRWGVVHRGKTYLFAGPLEQKKFLERPDSYSPAIAGHDVVLAFDHGQFVPGKRQFGVEFQNRIYLFAGEQSRQRFVQNGNRYAAQVLQAENPNRPVLR